MPETQQPIIVDYLLSLLFKGPCRTLGIYLGTISSSFNISYKQFLSAGGSITLHMPIN